MDIFPTRSFLIALASLALPLLFTGCDAPTPASPSGAGQAEPPATEEVRSAQGELRENQLAFLNRLRDADPDKRTIDRAMLNEQNELGLILDRSVELEKIPDLMRAMLTQMAAEFPGQDLTVIAYAPTNPPLKIGTATLDAQTRDMNYTAAQ